MGKFATILMFVFCCNCSLFSDIERVPADAGAPDIVDDSSDGSVCDNMIIDGTETGVDCGGDVCDACADDVSCRGASDCLSGLCVNSICRAAECNDDIKNGTETDIDCGGTSCAPCPTTKTCQRDSDCESRLCDGMICVESCADGILNGLESDIDCGGTACAGCLTGSKCSTSSDCGTGLACVDSACAPWMSDLTRDSRIQLTFDNPESLISAGFALPVFLSQIAPNIDPASIVFTDQNHAPIPWQIEADTVAWVVLPFTPDSDTTFFLYFASDDTPTMTDSGLVFEGAVATWLMEDGTDSSRSNDFSATRYDLQIDVDGASLDTLDSIESELNLSDLPRTGPVSILSRVFPRDVSGLHAIVARPFEGTSTDDFFFGVSSGSRWVVAMADNDGVQDFHRGGPVATIDNWITPAWRYDGTSSEIWLDGELVDKTDIERGEGMDQPFSIAANSSNGGASYNERFDGLLADIRIYDRVLTTDEIRLYHKGWTVSWAVGSPEQTRQ